MSCANSDETRLLLSDDSLETQPVKAKATPLPLVQLGGKHINLRNCDRRS